MRRKIISSALAGVAFAALSVVQLRAGDEKTPMNDRQLSVMMFVDYGRSYGYQTMMARIHVDTVKAELERDQKILEQKEELLRKRAIPPIELEVAQLKDAWNRKQLIVAEKSLEYISAEYAAMTQMAQHFGGLDIPVEKLYATFRRGWAAFSEKALERARQLNSQGDEPLASVFQKEANLKIAQSNYENRLAGLDKCRKTLFPSLEEIMAVK
ncbi:MAG: hypothetical protein MUC37_02270 [Hyphomicrobium sp.]|nr:hypothetical protein [Hyphomicrobium sp.]